MRRPRERGPRAMPQGLTLVEVLIVLIIIAVIAVIAIPQYLTAIQRAKETAAIAYMRQWITAQEQYKLQAVGYAEKLDELIQDGFLEPPNQKLGYEFKIEDEENGQEWSGTGKPQKKQWRHFYTDHTGTIRYEIGEKADEDSPPI